MRKVLFAALLWYAFCAAWQPTLRAGLKHYDGMTLEVRAGDTSNNWEPWYIFCVRGVDGAIILDSTVSANDRFSSYSVCITPWDPRLECWVEPPWRSLHEQLSYHITGQ